MKRILCILSALNAGGAETFLMKVYRTLPTEDYQMDFIVSADDGCYTQEVLERGGRIYKIPLRTKDLPGAMGGIKRVVRENGYDIVLKLGDTSLAALDLIAARLGGAKWLVMRSCNALTGQSKGQRCLHAALRPVLNWIADVKVAPSMLAAEYTFGKRVAHKEVKILHNGVDLNIFQYDPAGRYWIREEFSVQNSLVIGHVGRFHIQKNHQFLLKVFSKIHSFRKDAVLLLIGIGELENSIRDQARELEIENAVIFAGQRFDIPQLLSAMDVFVFPSFHEGMPNTVIEAQSTGLPCVIADTITREANITGLVRYLSLEQPAEEWANAALAAITEERKNTASDFWEHGYDIESVAREFLQLLRC